MNKPKFENYLEWKKKWLKRMAERGGHDCQYNFYGSLLLNNFEKAYPVFANCRVNDTFVEIIGCYIIELRVEYGFEWDNAKLESIHHPIFSRFMAEFKKNEPVNNLLESNEIKKLAPHIVQAYRTDSNSFFQLFKNNGFMTEMAHQLDPELSKEDAAQKMKKELIASDEQFQRFRPFSFNKNEIAFTAHEGTYVNIMPTVCFKEWLFNHEVEKPVKYANGWTVFKKDENTISFNQGSGSKGLVIKKTDDNLSVSNNFKADVIPEERNINLQSILVQLHHLGTQKEPKLYRDLINAPSVENDNTEEKCRVM